MATEPNEPVEGDTPTAEEAADRYFWLERDEVLGRLQGGWNPQIYLPSADDFQDYPFDHNTEGHPITEDEAKELIAQAEADAPEGEGEFASADEEEPIA